MMTVTHNGKLYHVSKMAGGYTWLLTEIGAPRNTATLNRDQMVIAGFGHIVQQSIVDTKTLRAALSKKAIARYLDDPNMLEQANETLRKALGLRVNRNSFEVRV